MYIFCIVSSVYIGYLFSFIPQVLRESSNEKTIEEYEEEDREEEDRIVELQTKMENKIENEFEFLDSDEEDMDKVD